jgi:hypothetical protein
LTHFTAIIVANLVTPKVGAKRDLLFSKLASGENCPPIKTLSFQADLEAKENQLDDLIRNAELQLKLLNEDKSNAYVTYQDLRSVPRFKNQTVMAIKAPPEAKLQVPHPSEVKPNPATVLRHSA